MESLISIFSISTVLFTTRETNKIKKTHFKKEESFTLSLRFGRDPQQAWRRPPGKPTSDFSLVEMAVGMTGKQFRLIRFAFRCTAGFRD